MWSIKDEMWNKQIGNNVESGWDFSGRQIYKSDFEKYDSPFGWTLIEFDDNEYLVVHVLTKQEFPKNLSNLLQNKDNEFKVNGKLFNVSKNQNNEWDINSIEYNEQFIPSPSFGNNKNKSMTLNEDMPKYETIEQSFKVNEQGSNLLNDTKTFSFKNYQQPQSEGQHMEKNKTMDETDLLIKEQQKEIEELKQQLAYEHTQHIEIENINRDLNRRNKELLANEQLKQKEEIRMLENELKNQQMQAKQFEYERNLLKIQDLKDEIHKTQQLYMNSLQNYQAEESTSKNLFSSARSSMPTSLDKDYPTYSTRTLDVISKTFKDNNQKELVAFSSTSKSFIDSLSKKLDEQTMQIKSLRDHQQNLKNMKKKPNDESSLRSQVEQENFSQASKIWTKKFGSDSFGTDFAGRIMVKDKFNKNEEGGWTLDFFSPNSFDGFIASKKTISDRNGKDSFIIDGINYFVGKNNEGNWEIRKLKKGKNFDYSSSKVTKIASSFKPDDEKVMLGNYESYSSLLINLNHFPLIHLDKFESFLKETLVDLPIFKDLFIYSNERLYKEDASNISAYARVFFKTSSTQNEIEILLLSISLKKGVKKFIDNFKSTNDRDNISFSMMLLSHQRRLKFIHAQTNFELLRAHPIPLKIPVNRLILDKEFNAILKFHENNLWKQLKPFALDWNGNVYYVCDIDPDKLDTIEQRVI